ncbi:hypothetical protein ACFSGX_14960 [Sphingomonas arantia]|uniref:Spore coat protein U domain-containing protein n=1 Tax=Sphingomonas arantia TaxID=1460676 RepID=A0ABW4U2I8_9SPHN
MAHTTGLNETRIAARHGGRATPVLARLRTTARAGSVALACMGAVIAAPVSAATQGSLGATSTGSIQISVSVPSRVQITGLSDITLANVEPNTPAISSQNNCVWSNTATKGYTITATGSGASGAFTLASGVLPPVAYDVQWNQASGQTAGTTLTPGTVSTGYVSTALIPGCATGSSSSMTVTIATAQLQTMPSLTNYTGTLTLLVNPA